MIISIQQPEHLPWIGFFNKMAQADVFVLLDHVQFKKNYFENRNRVKTKNGPTWITVPVLMKRRFGQKMNEVEVDNKTTWKRKYIKTIEQNYIRAPFYKDLVDFILPAFEAETIKLCDLNLDLIQRIAQYLEIDTKKVLSSELAVNDFFGGEMLLETCNGLDADTYISGPDGRKYLDKSSFDAAGIEIAYHDFIHPEYLQLQSDFTSHLSIIDLIANIGKKSVSLIRNCYKVPFITTEG